MYVCIYVYVCAYACMYVAYRAKGLVRLSLTKVTPKPETHEERVSGTVVVMMVVMMWVRLRGRVMMRVITGLMVMIG